MIINLDLSERGYDIVVERGALARIGELLRLDRKVLIVTDSGVPEKYAETVAAACKSPVIVTVNEGEGSKSFSALEMLCTTMLENSFTRADCVVAVGGGVVGDLSGFAAASYMRGIDFYNIPTTVLSQVDSSIGGKVAINLDSVKNIVGAFYQPKKVVIDPEVLATLPKRQIANGFAEAIKMGLTSDAQLFDIFEKGDPYASVDEIIVRSLNVKKSVVEQDERETGLRKILNFGHTVGHGIESEGELKGLLHGECVALGMIPMCSDQIRERLIKVLCRVGLPTTLSFDVEKVISAMEHDKKALGGGDITVTLVKDVGSFELVTMPIDKLKEKIMESFSK
jgi:3-dehydroquinate synthase